jgi:uncharacterized membrane protein YsdA (DUF1294 family)
MRTLRAHPYRAGIVIWMLFVGIYTALFLAALQVFWGIALLLALNAAAFTVYGTDKLFAMGQSYRIPERVLWFSAFFGGPVGALLGMYVFRHKVSKTSFHLALALVILLELLITLFILSRFHLLTF